MGLRSAAALAKGQAMLDLLDLLPLLLDQLRQQPPHVGGDAAAAGVVPQPGRLLGMEQQDNRDARFRHRWPGQLHDGA